MEIQELKDYIAQLSENERAYALAMENAMLDKIDSDWPETADYGLEPFRALEIAGVLAHFFEQYLTRQRESLSVTMLSLDATSVAVSDLDTTARYARRGEKGQGM